MEVSNLLLMFSNVFTKNPKVQEAVTTCLQRINVLSLNLRTREQDSKSERSLNHKLRSRFGFK